MISFTKPKFRKIDQFDDLRFSRKGPSFLEAINKASDNTTSPICQKIIELRINVIL